MAKNIQGAAPGAANSFLASSAEVSTINYQDVPAQEIQRVALCMLDGLNATDVFQAIPIEFRSQSQPLQVSGVARIKRIFTSLPAGLSGLGLFPSGEPLIFQVEGLQRFKLLVVNRTDAPVTLHFRLWSFDDQVSAPDKTPIASITLNPGERDSLYVELGGPPTDSWSYVCDVDNTNGTTGDIWIELKAYGEML